ncbi:MAG: S1C family serine protease [Planctomycetaceae bacterium]
MMHLPMIWKTAAAVLSVFVMGAWSAAQEPEVNASRGLIVAGKVFRQAAAKGMSQVVVIEGLAGNEADAGPSTGLWLPETGEVLTSTFNLRANPRTITVRMPDGRRMLAQMRGRDETRRIVLLKIEEKEQASGKPSLEVLRRDAMQPGMWVIALGGAPASELSGKEDQKEPVIGPLSVGILSATERISRKTVQTDANLNPSNYGGPVLDIEGRLVGIAVPFVPGAKSEADNAQWYDAGVGFVVPLDGLADVLSRLRAGEVLKGGLLGAEIKPGKGETTGAVLGKLVKEGAAEKGGLLAGDRVVAIEKRRVMDATQLKSVLGEFLAGETIVVRIVRDGGEIERSVVLQEANPEKSANNSKKLP